MMSLEETLGNEHARRLFMEFLQKEYSQENLEFYLDCQRFKQITDRKSLGKCSKAIYELYIDSKGSRAINIAASTRKEINQALNKPTSDMFHKAEQEIYKLMASDSFVRFRQSQPFRQLCGSATPNRKRKSPDKANHMCSNEYENCPPTSETPPPLLPRKLKTPKKVRFELEYANNDLAADTQLDVARSKSFVSEMVRSSPRLALPTRRYLRLTLPDTTCEYLSLSDGDLPLATLVSRVLAKHQLNYKHYKLYSTIDNREVDGKQPACRLNINDIRLEQMIEFIVHFPEGYLIEVETTTIKLSAAVLRIILAHFNINWLDIELLDERGRRLTENDLMHPTGGLDGRRLFVRYLSSLRTYLNLKDLNDLNEDGICIKSIRFEQYNPPPTLPAEPVLRRDALPSTLLNSFIVDNREQGQRKMFVAREQPNEPENTYDLPPDGIDVSDLSFSDPATTDHFLDSLMASNDRRPMPYFSTPTKAKKKKMPRPVPSPGHHAPPGVHRAHLAVIDPNTPSPSSLSHHHHHHRRQHYVNNDVAARIRAGEQLHQRLQTSNSHACCADASGDIGLPCPVQHFMSRRIDAHVAGRLASPIKPERFESPFRHYLLKSRQTSISNHAQSGSRQLSSPSRPTAFVASASQPVLRTLSKFHKIT